MYGDATVDPAVKYYDLAFAAGATSDIAWFVKEAMSSGSPVLDLCCGTGRISIELARQGQTVTALDTSAGMLSILKDRLSMESEQVRDLVCVDEQPMANFRLRRKFRSVICCDAFFHNMSPDEERACLHSINRHLKMNGMLFFNIHNNPNPEFLAWASSKEAATPHKRGEYSLPENGGMLEVFESLFHDPFNQTVKTKLHFKKIGPSGEILEETDSSWNSRYMCRFETMYLLELCGFKVEGVYGGYCGEPLTASSQLVLKCCKTRNVVGIRRES
jgi:ubiquinone/menaquinone biosynthesis C-methylase UbiE